MRQTLLIFLGLFATISAFAQQGPVYGQYFHNPFLYNPAYAGADKYPMLTLTHQRHLSGIEDAPQASSLTFHTPLLKKLAIGTLIHTERQGLISNSSGQLALAYVLPLNENTNLRFGLAGGVSKNQLDLSSATESQLAYLANISRTFYQADVRFGMVVHNEKASIGFSLPNMTRRSLLTEDHFKSIEVDPFEHLTFNGSYKFELSPNKLQLEPLFIYERFNSTGEQRIEGGAVLYLKELVWLGGTYQFKHGFSGLFGIKIKERFSFGYAYGMNTGLSGLFKNATHELQLKVQLGKEKEVQEAPRKHMPRFQSTDF